MDPKEGGGPGLPECGGLWGLTGDMLVGGYQRQPPLLTQVGLGAGRPRRDELLRARRVSTAQQDPVSATGPQRKSHPAPPGREQMLQRCSPSGLRHVLCRLWNLPFLVCRRGEKSTSPFAPHAFTTRMSPSRGLHHSVYFLVSVFLSLHNVL